MQTIDLHAERHHLCDLIEALDARLGSAYDPELDDLEREFAELRWRLCDAWPAALINTGRA